MVQVIQVRKATIGVLKQEFGLALVRDPEFFPEGQEINPELTDLERQWLDRIRENFLGLLDNPPLLENSVKMVILSPLLDLAGFYRDPFRIESEVSVEVEMEDEIEGETEDETEDGRTVIRGRIDVLVVKEQLWLLVIEAKQSEFAVKSAIAQALAGMLGNPDPQRPTFGLVTNGNDFIFLKLTRNPNQYANSRLFSLDNPGNELYGVLGVLKRIGSAILA